MVIIDFIHMPLITYFMFVARPELRGFCSTVTDPVLQRM